MSDSITKLAMLVAGMRGIIYIKGKYVTSTWMQSNWRSIDQIRPRFDCGTITIKYIRLRLIFDVCDRILLTL